MNADGLESAGRRIGLLARAETGGTTNDRGELGGALDRPRRNDRAGDRPGARLLPIIAQHPDDLGFVSRVQKLGGGQARLAHAHVERTVALEREAALGAVELHRADADIERDGIDQSDAALGKHAVHLAEVLVDERQSGVRDERPSFLDRIGVAIEADHSSRPRPEHGARVAACSEGAVDYCLAALNAERGDHVTDQHRHMWGLFGAGAGHDWPRSSRRKRAMSLRSSGMRGSASRSCGFQIWNVSPVPRNSASSPIWPLRRIIGGKTILPELS